MRRLVAIGCICLGVLGVAIGQADDAPGLILISLVFLGGVLFGLQRNRPVKYFVASVGCLIGVIVLLNGIIDKDIIPIVLGILLLGGSAMFWLKSPDRR